jgi:hypothetical protein
MPTGWTKLHRTREHLQFARAARVEQQHELTDAPLMATQGRWGEEELPADQLVTQAVRQRAQVGGREAAGLEGVRRSEGHRTRIFQWVDRWWGFRGICPGMPC